MAKKTSWVKCKIQYDKNKLTYNQDLWELSIDSCVGRYLIYGYKHRQLHVYHQRVTYLSMMKSIYRYLYYQT